MSVSDIYRPHAAAIPASQREKINRGILNLIRSGQNPDRAKVFAGYTGRGGLHGLKYADFANRHEYSEAKRAIEQGQFFTPDAVVRLIAAFLDVPAGEEVADFTCGAGAFANHFRRQKFFGLEIDADAVTIAKYLYPEAEIVEGDLRAWTPSGKIRFGIGNPPFSLRWSVSNCPLANMTGEAASEDVFLWKATEALAAGGTLCFVAPATWLSDDITDAKALSFIHGRLERVAEVVLPANAFASVGVDCFATKIVLLRKWLPEEVPQKTIPVVVDGRALAEDELLLAWRNACAAYFEFRNRLGGKRAVLAIADQREGRKLRSEALTFSYRYLRLLSELERRAPASANTIRTKWAEAHAPAQYDKEGNRLSQVTPERVVKLLRAELRDLDATPKDVVRVVRTKSGITVKAHSRVAARAISDSKFFASNEEIAAGKWDAAALNAAIDNVKAAIVERNQSARVIRGESPRVAFEGLNVTHAARRLRRRHLLWERPLAADFAELPRFRDSVRAYYGRFGSLGIVVREEQVDSVARLAAKPGCFIAWEMGCGKSLASLAWDGVKREEDRSRRARSGWTLIVSSALAIELHWSAELSKFDLPFVRPGSRDELMALPDAPADGQRFILATHHQVTRNAKTIRGLVRRGVITALIVDESDEFGNPASRRTQALNVAGREIRHKAMLTGTPVRNNAGELFSQLSLLLHGETFFRCVARHQYVFDHKVGDFLLKENPEYLAPYRGRGAFALYKRCHAPARPTVLGAERALPHLPGREEMEAYLACFRSRLRLRTLRASQPFIRRTHAVQLGAQERAIYDRLKLEAITIAKRHLEADRSERRATMLSLAHAIRLLQQALSMPARHGLAGMGAKESALIEQIQASSATHVAVGVIWRDSITRLLPILQAAFPARLVVAIDGDDSFRSRRRLLDQIAAAPSAILLCTQQSVRSSLNVPVITKVIAESFPWNFTSLNQWAMRFCRLTSRTTVDVELLAVADSIEERILGLLLRKEMVAAPLAGDGASGDEELFSEYGIPADDLDELARYLVERDPTIREARAA